MRIKNLLTWVVLMVLLVSFSDAKKKGIKEEIAAIENGLQSAILVKGEPEKTFNILERMDQHKVPGLSIAVIKDGEIRWAKGYGIANSVAGTHVNAKTLFQAGSISKPVAALAVLKLADQGILDLDVDVNRYLKKWKVPENEFTQTEKVTLRRILTHTAGLTVHGFPGYATSDTFPSDLQVLNGLGNTEAIQPDVVPGSIWRYSGGGYTVMENLVEDVTGKDFASFMQEQILDPLGMANSTYEQPLPEKKHKNASAAYDSKGKIIEGYWLNYPEQAAAGLWTTPTDLAKYLIELQDIATGKKTGILSKAMLDQMLKKNKNNWGLGPSLKWDADSLMFGHGGKNAGFTNDMIAYVHHGDGVVVMTNGDNGGRIISEIYRAVCKQYGWTFSQQRTVDRMALEESEALQLQGKYQLYKQKPDDPDYLIEIGYTQGEITIFDPSVNFTYHLIHLGRLRFIDAGTADEVLFMKPGEAQNPIMIWNGRYRFNRVE